MKLLMALIIFPLALFANDDYQSWTDDYDTKYVYIEGLKNDLFQKYIVKDSRGPKWGRGDNAIDLISELTDTDLWYWASYWSESGYPLKQCPYFSEEDMDIAEQNDIKFRWQAVKKKKGSKKTVFYFVTVVLKLEANGKTCEYDYSNSNEPYVFLNQYKDGKPIYLGRLQAGPQ